MKTLLSLLTAVSMTGPTVTNLVSKTNENQSFKIEDKIYSPDEKTKINLNNIKLEPQEINLFNIMDKLDDEKVVATDIMSELLKNNSTNAEFVEVSKSFTKSYDSWFVALLDLPRQVGGETSGDLMMFNMDDESKFEGVLLVKNLKIVLKDTQALPKLSSIIDVKDLGKISEVNTQEIKDRVLSKNEHTDLKASDFFVSVLNYEYAIIKATSNSGYTGGVKITFDYVMSEISEISTDVARSDAYDSTQSDFQSNWIIVDVDLGREEFLQKYSKMEYELSGYYWVQGDYKYNFTINKDENLVNKVEDSKNENGDSIDNEDFAGASHNEPKYSEISLNGRSSKSVFKLTYKNVNEEETWGTLSTAWIEEDTKLLIMISVETKVWSTAWNAYWARAEAQMHIGNIKFI
ncbi:hypothetical protein SCLARK_001823 [Spiroplasma clarkii]|uniref:Uncharacterized protein n=1 Tax=Spiroplasma clarkii TaxID=2139 RepID=A0A1Y0L2N3_9MOLU|nr:hypothetical protein [Spiroplasma clarkii]ARU92266.1 hypothetical protein SCLARK_001823 [Spiroplasma clarkii]ATX71579.1 hypothetical protein SCLAR_v1c12810 [Spiroplasma clarkii]